MHSFISRRTVVQIRNHSSLFPRTWGRFVLSAGNRPQWERSSWCTAVNITHVTRRAVQPWYMHFGCTSRDWYLTNETSICYQGITIGIVDLGILFWSYNQPQITFIFVRWYWKIQKWLLNINDLSFYTMAFKICSLGKVKMVCLFWSIFKTLCL